MEHITIRMSCLPISFLGKSHLKFCNPKVYMLNADLKWDCANESLMSCSEVKTGSTMI